MDKISTQIESYLFFKGEPVTIKDLISLFETDEETIVNALNNIKKTQEERNSGIVLITYGGEVTLGTHPISADFIEELTKEELQKDLGKSSLETLSIVLYKGPIKRSEIDYIRGVNSQFILRNLTMRGLVDRVVDKDDERTFFYKPSLELLTHMGIQDIKDLPEYDETINKLKELEKND